MKAHSPIASNRIAGMAGNGRGCEQHVIDPSNGQVLWTYPADTSETVNAAIDAAHPALPDWSRATPAERPGVLVALAGEMKMVAEDLAQAETAQAGKPVRHNREFDVPGAIDNVAFFAGAARHLDGKAVGECSEDHTSMIRRHPVGVVGSITSRVSQSNHGARRSTQVGEAQR